MLIHTFVLEDDPNRIEWFQKQFGESMVHTDDVLEAIEILKNSTFDLIFLDHDLGGGAYMRGENGDGIDLVEWMAKEESHVDVPIIIHSLNKPGADNMMAALKDTHSRVARVDFVTLRYRLGVGAHQILSAIEKTDAEMEKRSGDGISDKI